MTGARFHDGVHGATHAVTVFPFGRELRIAGADGATLAMWPIAGVRAAPEIDPDGAVTLTARPRPGVLLIDDPAILDNLHRAGIRLPGRRAWTHRLWLAVGAGVAAVFVLGALTVNQLPRWIASAIPLAWDARLGQAAETLVSRRKDRCRGAAGQAALDRFVARLREAGGIATPVTIAVLDDPAANAFTLPGGRVLVMRGLLGAASDGPMLAGVIAHELGHVAHHDPTAMLIRGLEFSLLLNAIGAGNAGGAAAGAGHLLTLAYSRAAETAADASALDFLTRAGLRADGLSRFFALMPQREGAGAVPDWFATHPSSASRRERTARPETGEAPFTEAEWQAIRSMCGPREGPSAVSRDN